MSFRFSEFNNGFKLSIDETENQIIKNIDEKSELKEIKPTVIRIIERIKKENLVEIRPIIMECLTISLRLTKPNLMIEMIQTITTWKFLQPNDTEFFIDQSKTTVLDYKENVSNKFINEDDESLCNSIFSRINKYLDHLKFHKSIEYKSNPDFKEQSVRLQQDILSNDQINPLLKNTLGKIASYNFENAQRFVRIHMVHSEGEDKSSWTNDFILSLITHLKQAGIQVSHSSENNDDVNIQKINNSQAVILIGTPYLLRKYYESDTNTILHKELETASKKMKFSKERSLNFILFPLLLTGDKSASFPPQYLNTYELDFKNEKNYLEFFKKILMLLYGIQDKDHHTKLWDEFSNNVKKMNSNLALFLELSFDQQLARQKLISEVKEIQQTMAHKKSVSQPSHVESLATSSPMLENNEVLDKKDEVHVEKRHEGIAPGGP